ncbi:MAG: MlaA family lipoprotein [Alphaproteobacteria bacterium]
MRPFSVARFQADLRDAQAPDADPAEPTALDDPLESVNRQLHLLNTQITQRLLAPAADVMAEYSSPGFQSGFTNIMANLREPVSAGSALVEGNYDAARQTTVRFLLNSTIGILGYKDVASDMGYPERPRTLGLALCRRGVPNGPYVVMPVFGPSTLRDAGGFAVTAYAQYMVLGAAIIPYRALDVLSAYIGRRQRLRLLDDEAMDAYVRYRSAYGQILAVRCGQTSPNGMLTVPG